MLKAFYSVHIALAAYMSVTNRQTDHVSVTGVAIVA